jgi:hypothetical protein
VGVGTLGRAAGVLAPDGPNNEGVPASAPASGPSVDHGPPNQINGVKIPGAPVDNNHLHFNPYPYVGGPGQPQVCEAGNESYVTGTTIGNQPSSGSRHEETKRENNLFGERYPQATLEALGLAGSKAAKK